MEATPFAVDATNAFSVGQIADVADAPAAVAAQGVAFAVNQSHAEQSPATAAAAATTAAVQTDAASTAVGADAAAVIHAESGKSY